MSLKEYFERPKQRIGVAIFSGAFLVFLLAGNLINGVPMWPPPGIVLLFSILCFGNIHILLTGVQLERRPKQGVIFFGALLVFLLAGNLIHGEPMWPPPSEVVVVAVFCFANIPVLLGMAYVKRRRKDKSLSGMYPKSNDKKS